MYKSKFTGPEVDEAIERVLNEETFNKSGRYPDMSVGFSDDLVGRGESTPTEFSFRASGGKSIKDGSARIKRLKGNSVVWNNMVDTRRYESGFTIREGIKIQQGHKYLLQRSAANSGLYLIPMVDGSENYEMLLYPGEYAKIVTSQYTDLKDAVVYAEQYCGACIVSDLTLMFQAGYEPTTIEEYNARKPIVADEYAFNEGEVIHMTAEGIKSIGDNAWDEEWESGYINSGTEIMDGNAFSSINHIKVLPNETYYFTISALSGDSYFYIWLYDQNKNVLGYSTINKYGDGLLSVPSNCHYIRFYVEGMTTYNHDILISLYHSGWKAQKDDQYQPYWQDTLPLPIIRKYFPDGMKKAGTAHDEIRYNKASGKWEKVVRIGSVDMGTLSWAKSGVYTNGYYALPLSGAKPLQYPLCRLYSAVNVSSQQDKSIYVSNNGGKAQLFVIDSAYTDVASFKAAMSGVILYYELAEPIVTELDAEDQNFRDYYNVADFGTEQSQSEVPSANFSADIIYQFNAVDMIREHELEITELQRIIATMQAQLTSLTSNNGGQ